MILVYANVNWCTRKYNFIVDCLNFTGHYYSVYWIQFSNLAGISHPWLVSLAPLVALHYQFLSSSLLLSSCKPLMITAFYNLDYFFPLSLGILYACFSFSWWLFWCNLEDGRDFRLVFDQGLHILRVKTHIQGSSGIVLSHCFPYFWCIPVTFGF